MLGSIIEHNNGISLPCQCNNEAFISRERTNSTHLCHYQTDLSDRIILSLTRQLATQHTKKSLNLERKKKNMEDEEMVYMGGIDLVGM